MFVTLCLPGVEGIFAGDPLLSCVARVTLLYYMGVWAVVSTLMIYLVAQFGLSQVSACEFCTGRGKSRY